MNDAGTASGEIDGREATTSLIGGETLVVSRHGGQVVSWRDRSGKELLYLSPLASAGGGSAIRGGVPVCFPQFASRGPLMKHGFARNRPWRQMPDAGAGAIRMVLTDDEATRAMWPFRFRLELLAQLKDQSLVLKLSVHNTDEKPWTFTAALHTYLRTESVAGSSLEGLSTHVFEDALAEGALRQDTGPDLSQPLDRIYMQVLGPMFFRDGTQTLRISQKGFSDVVVWNPGPTTLADLPVGDHSHMLCVEAAQVCTPIWLEPGEAWVGTQTLDQCSSLPPTTTNQQPAQAVEGR